MDGEIEDKETQLLFYLEAFQPYIIEHVPAEDLIAYYELYTPAQRKCVGRLMREKPNEAASKAFDIIINEVENRDKYKHLLAALDEAGYPKIVSILNGKAIPINKSNREQIRKLTPLILKRLNVAEIVPYLRAKSVLNDKDVGELLATVKSKGNWHAVLELVFMLLPNRSAHWYRCFIEALMESNHAVLAQKIDAELCAHIEAQRQSGDDETVFDDTQSVMPLYLLAESQPETDSHETRSMQEVPVTAAEGAGSIAILEDEFYAEPSINNLDAPPSISPLDNFDLELSSLTTDTDTDTHVAARPWMGEPRTTQPKGWRHAKPKAVVTPLNPDDPQQNWPCSLEVGDIVHPAVTSAEDGTHSGANHTVTRSNVTVDTSQFQLLQKARSISIENEENDTQVLKLQMLEKHVERSRVMRENSPGPVAKEMRDKDIDRVDLEKQDNIPPNITESARESMRMKRYVRNTDTTWDTQREQTYYSRSTNDFAATNTSFKTSSRMVTSEILVENAVIKGFHKYKITPPHTKPPTRLPVHRDMEFTDIQNNRYGFNIFMRRGRKFGKTVGHPPTGLTDAFHRLFEKNCLIFAEVTGLPTDSFPPWPPMYKKGGGMVIPCNYVVECDSSLSSDVFDILWACLTDMEEGSSMSLKVI